MRRTTISRFFLYQRYGVFFGTALDSGHTKAYPLARGSRLTLNGFSPIALRGRPAAERGIATLAAAVGSVPLTQAWCVICTNTHKFKQYDSLGVAFLSFRIIIEEFV